MPNREPFEMHLNAIDDVTLRQLSDESEMNAFPMHLRTITNDLKALAI